MSKIVIVGLGPAEDGLLTIDALKALKKAKHLVLRTSCHPLTAFLEKEDIDFESFDHIYEESKDFEEVYERVAESLICLAKKHKKITYAVPGHPLVGEKTTFKLLKKCQDSNIAFEIIPGLSFLDSLYSALLIDPLQGVQIVDALQISEQLVSPGFDLIITQVFSRLVASEVKLKLLAHYPSDWPVTIVKSAGSRKGEQFRSLPLAELDHYKEFDHLTSLYVHSCKTPSKVTFSDLVKTMSRLRGPFGCPWDREQTHNTLKRHLIEESYEVIEAIDNNNAPHLMEELGDLLLQIVFHAQIAAEEGTFTIENVLEGITSKLIERHPHIFGQEDAETPEDVMVHWEAAKKREGKTKLLSGIPQALPALLYAYNLQKKAARVGFDWEKETDVLDKLSEEVDELKQVCLEAGETDRLEDEIGDILFTVANVARRLGVEPESALRKTLKKFITRFEHIEKEAEKKKMHLADMSLQEKGSLWDEAKRLEREE